MQNERFDQVDVDTQALGYNPSAGSRASVDVEQADAVLDQL